MDWLNHAEKLVAVAVALIGFLNLVLLGNKAHAETRKIKAEEEKIRAELAQISEGVYRKDELNRERRNHRETRSKGVFLASYAASNIFAIIIIFLLARSDQTATNASIALAVFSGVLIVVPAIGLAAIQISRTILDSVERLGHLTLEATRLNIDTARASLEGHKELARVILSSPDREESGERAPRELHD